MSIEKKVLIFMPTIRGIERDPSKWLSSFITVLNGVRNCNLGHATYFPYQGLWWPTWNEAWHIAFSHGFDYILRLDDDIWNVPIDGFKKLYDADKDVIGAAYPNRRFPYKVCALNKTTDEDLILTSIAGNLTLDSVQNYDYEGQDVQKCDLVGMGMTLIRTKAFRFVERPLFKGDEVCPDDTYFAQLCIDHKIEQFVHWGVRLNHDYVTFANAGHLFNADLINNSSKEAEYASK